MQRFCFSLLVALAVAHEASAGRSAKGSPMAKVVNLLNQLKAGVEGDGQMEQQSYDKYSCWCENALERKAADISHGKEQITTLQALITKLGGEIAAHGAEIKQLEKDIAENKQAQRDATELREKENGEYEAEKTESEQCIGALEAAIGALSGAGAGKAGFLQTQLQEAQLLSTVSGVREVLQKSSAVFADRVSSADVELVEKFVAHPQDFFAHANSAGLAQVGNNPFGDYAPQSGQIQGILKSMYDSFAGDLEKDNADEADKEKAFRAFMATKKQELETLENTLEKQQLDEAEKKKTVAESRSLLDDTKTQLEADEVFFADTKEGCKIKAGQWAERTRLRTEELQGIIKAIEILSGGEETFAAATTSFVQLSSRTVQHASIRSHAQMAARASDAAYKALSSRAHAMHSLRLAKLAAQVSEGGHFDKVIAAIDEMVTILRAEEQDDIKHRDRCERSENQNGNQKEDLNSGIAKDEAEIGRLGNTETDTKAAITALDAQMLDTEGDMNKTLEMRNQDHEAFKKQLKDDAVSIKLIEEAIVSLAKFYKKNKIPLALAQQEPEYTVDPDKAPEETFSGDYGGRKSENEGIIAILSMLQEDLEKEMKEGREDDAAAQAAYDKDRKALDDTLAAQGASKAANEKELQDLEEKIQDTTEAKETAQEELANNGKMASALQTDCAWVKTNFDSRAKKRTVEMAGLVEAKDYLAGVQRGDEIE